MFPSVGSAEPSARRCAWIFKHSVGILIRFVKSEMILFLMKLSCVPQRCLQCLFIQYRINNVDYGGVVTGSHRADCVFLILGKTNKSTIYINVLLYLFIILVARHGFIKEKQLYVGQFRH